MQGHFASVFGSEIIHVIAWGLVERHLRGVNLGEKYVCGDAGPVAFGIDKSLAMKLCFGAVIRSQDPLVPQIVHRIRTQAKNICEVGAGAMLGDGSRCLSRATESNVVNSEKRIFLSQCLLKNLKIGNDHRGIENSFSFLPGLIQVGALSRCGANHYREQKQNSKAHEGACASEG